MGNLYSLNYTKAIYQAVPGLVAPGNWQAPVKAYYEEYEAVAAQIADVIYMFRPQKGMKYKGTGQLAWDDLGTAVTLAVGILGATAKFLAATDAATAADKADLDAGATAIDALGYEFDGVTDVIITVAGGVATGTIKLLMDFFST